MHADRQFRWINRQKSWLKYFIALGATGHLISNLLMSGMFLYASARNYPGGDALAHLQHIQRFNQNEARTVHIDEFCAQTGINRFIEFYSAWSYNKTENLSVEQLQKFDFLLIGSQTGDLRKSFVADFSKTHKELFAVEAFNRLTYVRSKQFPYYFPSLKFKEKVLVLKNLNL